MVAPVSAGFRILSSAPLRQPFGAGPVFRRQVPAWSPFLSSFFRPEMPRRSGLPENLLGCLAMSQITHSRRGIDRRAFARWPEIPKADPLAGGVDDLAQELFLHMLVSREIWKSSAQSSKRGRWARFGMWAGSRPRGYRRSRAGVDDRNLRLDDFKAGKQHALRLGDLLRPALKKVPPSTDSEADWATG